MTTPGKWLLRACWFVLLAGALVISASLLAPGGVWLNWWPHETGFAILAAVHPSTAPAAIGVLALALLLYVLGRKIDYYYAGLFLCLHLIIAFSCGLAWYLPAPYVDPAYHRHPPIHDISTDVVDIPQFRAVLSHRINAPGTEYGRSFGMTPEHNARLQREFYPDLVSQVYDIAPDDMYYRAYAVAIDLGWSIVAASPEEGIIEATASTFWFRMKEDVVVRIRDEGGRSRVDARSISRVEGGDGGSNARRLRKFFKKLSPDDAPS